MKMGHFNGGVQPLVMYAQVLLDWLIRLLSFFINPRPWARNEDAKNGPPEITKLIRTKFCKKYSTCEY